MFQITPQLFEKIKHFARFPQTGVSLRQMVMFGNAISPLLVYSMVNTLLISRGISQDNGRLQEPCLKQASFCMVSVFYMH